MVRSPCLSLQSLEKYRNEPCILGGILLTHLSSLFSSQLLSSQIQQIKHTAALSPDYCQAQRLALLFPTVKSAMHGLGTMIAKLTSALSIMSALCASGITKPKPALNRSIQFHQIVKTPLLTINFLPRHLTHWFLLSNPQPVSHPKPIAYHLNFNQDPSLASHS